MDCRGKGRLRGCGVGAWERRAGARERLNVKEMDEDEGEEDSCIYRLQPFRAHCDDKPAPADRGSPEPQQPRASRLRTLTCCVRLLSTRCGSGEPRSVSFSLWKVRLLFLVGRAVDSPFAWVHLVTSVATARCRELEGQ